MSEGQVLLVRNLRDVLWCEAIACVCLVLATVVVGDVLDTPGTGPIGILFAAGFATVGLWIGVRAPRYGVTVDGTSVTCRTMMRTHRLRASEISRFELGRLRFPDRPAVVVARVDGSHLIVSTLSTSPLDIVGRSTRIDRHVDQLNAALRQASLPPTTAPHSPTNQNLGDQFGC